MLDQGKQQESKETEGWTGQNRKDTPGDTEYDEEASDDDDQRFEHG
jgi:hypothetical protein